MPTFDAVAAKAAGMTDEQIQAHIAKRRAEGVNLSIGPGDAGSRAMMNVDPIGLGAAARRIGPAMPDVLGAIGGLLPGPAGYVGAPIGGMVGEGANQAISGEDMPMMERMSRIGKAAAKQEAFQVGGGLLAKGMRFAARPLMERALRIGPLGAGKVTPRMLRERATTAIQHRIPVGGRKLLGSEKAIAAAQVSGKELSGLLDQAEKAGASILPGDIAEPLIALYDDITHQPLSAGDKKSIMQMTKQFLKEHPGPMTPKSVKLLKQRAQQLALPIIKNRQVRPGTNARDAIEGRFNDAIATGAKRALENIQMPVPGSAASRTFGQAIGGREGITSNLLDLADATRRAEAATSKVSFSPFGPLRPFGAATPMLRLSRPTVSQLALGASHHGTSLAARQAPRTIDALLHQLMYQEPDSTGGSE